MTAYKMCYCTVRCACVVFLLRSSLDVTVQPAPIQYPPAYALPGSGTACKQLTRSFSEPCACACLGHDRWGDGFERPAAAPPVEHPAAAAHARSSRAQNMIIRPFFANILINTITTIASNLPFYSFSTLDSTNEHTHAQHSTAEPVAALRATHECSSWTWMELDTGGGPNGLRVEAADAGDPNNEQQQASGKVGGMQ